MRINSWNTETERGDKVHTGSLADPEPAPDSIHVSDKGAVIILHAPDGRSFRVTFTPGELKQLQAA